MDNDELRLQIALLQGFTKIRKYPDGRWTGEHDTEEWGSTRDNIPDWTSDISAAYALEDEIPEDHRTAYGACLLNVVRRDKGHTYTLYDILHATPEQRCRAYLAWKQQVTP